MAQKKNASIKKFIGAISKGKRKVLELLEKGFDVNTKLNDGNTLLHYACDYTTYKSTILENLNSLNEEEEEQEGQERQERQEQEKEKEVVELLLEKGANINAQNLKGQTPLMIALLSKYFTSIVDFLLTKDIDVNIKDNNGYTALYYALSAGLKTESAYSIEKLLEKGANINAQSNNGMTPFMVAVLNNNIDAMKVIQKAPDFDINIQDNSGQTALIHAVIEKIDIEHLLEAGADIKIRNKEGMTAHMISLLNKNYNAISILENYGSKINQNDVNIIDFTKFKYKIRRMNTNTIQDMFPFLNNDELLLLGIYTYMGDKYMINFLKGNDNDLSWYKNPRFTALFEVILKEDSIVPYQKIVYEYFKKLYMVIEKFPHYNHDLEVFRGVKSHYLGDDTTKISYINSFTSTSMNKIVAEQFAIINSNNTRNTIKPQLIYKFILHPMCKYAEISDISYYPLEEEVILNPYEKIRFINQEQIEKEDGSLQIMRTYVILPGETKFPKEFDVFMEWKNKINAGNMKGGKVNTLKQNRKMLNLLKTNKGMNFTRRKSRNKNITLSKEFSDRMTDPIVVVGRREITEKEKQMTEEVLVLSKNRW